MSALNRTPLVLVATLALLANGCKPSTTGQRQANSSHQITQPCDAPPAVKKELTLFNTTLAACVRQWISTQPLLKKAPPFTIFVIEAETDSKHAQQVVSVINDPDIGLAVGSTLVTAPIPTPNRLFLSKNIENVIQYLKASLGGLANLMNQLARHPNIKNSIINISQGLSLAAVLPNNPLRESYTTLSDLNTKVAKIHKAFLPNGELYDVKTKYDNAFRALINKGAVVIIAAGNGRKPTKEFSSQAAQEAYQRHGLGKNLYTTDDMIIVGASRQAPNHESQLSAFSSPNDSLDLLAPGENVFTKTNGEGYISNTAGTSFSAPFVAAIVARMRQFNPALTPKQLEAILKNTADSRGFINPIEAMESAQHTK
jgi:hypothetical protein